MCVDLFRMCNEYKNYNTQDTFSGDAQHRYFRGRRNAKWPDHADRKERSQPVFG